MAIIVCLILLSLMLSFKFVDDEDVEDDEGMIRLHDRHNFLLIAMGVGVSVSLVVLFVGWLLLRSCVRKGRRQPFLLLQL